MSLNCIEDGEYASEFDALDSLFNVKFISDCLICWSTVLFCACLLFFAFYWFYCKYCMSAWNRRADLLQCFWGQIAFLVLMEPTGPKSCKRIDRIDYRCDSIVVLGIPLRSISSWRTGQELFTWLTSLEAFTFEVVRVLGDVEYGRKLRQYIFTYLYISLHIFTFFALLSFRGSDVCRLVGASRLRVGSWRHWPLGRLPTVSSEACGHTGHTPETSKFVGVKFCVFCWSCFLEMIHCARVQEILLGNWGRNRCQWYSTGTS